VPRGGAGSGSTGRLPGRPGSLHVAVRPAPGDPLALLRVLERLTSARVPGCTTVRLERLVRPYAGAAEWEYTCGAGAARRHAVVRSQRMGTGTVTVRWASPERAWPRDRAHLGSAFDAAVAAAVAAAGEGGSGAGPGTASRAAVRAALAVLSASAPARR
jgi:hypothetical protein